MTAETRAAEVLAEHFLQDEVCRCGDWTASAEESEPWDAHAAHVAAALSAAGCLRDDREGETVTEWGASDRADVAAWLIREADQRVKFFPQRRDGVDAVMRGLAAMLRAPVTPDGGDQR